MEEKPVLVVAKQGAAFINSEPLQLACEPEIKNKTFNSKFVSVSRSESPSRRGSTTTRAKEFEKNDNSTTTTLRNNFSRNHRTPDYHSHSSNYYNHIQNDYSYTPNGRSHTPHYYSQTKYSSSDRILSTSNSDDRQSTDTIVNFYPVDQKGPNYLKYCTGWLLEHEKPLSMRDCILKYTSGSGWYCSEINFALASDSLNLKKYGSYIKELKYCIGISPAYVGTVYRGVDMSSAEVAAYETQDIFFIPSFTSTSKTRAFSKNTLLHIDITPEWSKFSMEIQPAQTNYSEEEEVLLSCYNLYRYERTEKLNSKRVIKLRLMDYDKYFDYRTNIIKY